MHTLTRGNIDNNSTPTHAASNPGYEADAQSTHTRTTHTEYQNDYPTLDRPPSYETSMRNTKQSNVNNYYGSDRQSVRSVRSARSTRSKASVRSKRRQEQRQERREDLPWVQITPSASNLHSDQAAYGHFPHIQ